MSNRFWKTVICSCATFILCLTTARILRASESPVEVKGFTFYGALQGSANSEAQVNRLEGSVGYNFNRTFGVDFGLPFYFVHSSVSSDPSLNGFRSGLGNAYMNFRITPALNSWHYVPSLMVTAPTGDRDQGFSTGRVTLDWNNFVSRPFRRFTPFSNLGIGNTISDTNFFSRPFSSLGVVGHFEGGTSYRLHRSLSVGASAYSVVPSGEQKIYSRVAKGQSNVTAAANAAPGQGRSRAFESSAVIVDAADLARDHGFASWLTIYPSATTYLQTGYHRSVPYSLNTFFFGVGIQLDSVYQRIIHP
jgi:hypothetical protein